MLKHRAPMLKHLLINKVTHGYTVVLEENNMPWSLTGTIIGTYPTEEEAKEAANLVAVGDPSIFTDEAAFNKEWLKTRRIAFGIEP